MIARFTEFFLKNEKITFILILIISIFGMLSYIMLPKQYNPSIVAPAFLIEVPAYGYDTQEGHEYIVKTLENKIKEIIGVDTVYGYATDGFVSVMIAFDVGLDQEVAKTRLYDKLYSNYVLRPYSIEDIRIRSIDPEDLPQVSYALVYTGSTDLSLREQGQYLQNIAKTLQENIKTIPGTTTIDIIGGYSNDISIELLPTKIEAYGLDILSVVGILKDSFGKGYIGNLVNEDKKYSIFIERETDTLDTLKNLIIISKSGKKILLQDVAHIGVGPVDITSHAHFATKYMSTETVFIGVAKLKGTNAVSVVEKVHEVVAETRASLPKNIEIITIQDEGETAREATNELMFHLFVSIAIVLVILIIFLGVRDAINAAFCIPMVLGIVFIVALVLGLDINRITLFALILSLGILVDDSIVMVENNARHLAMIPRTGKSKYEAIIDSVKEVGVSIVLSTITRVISFVAMFAVTGMMGDYMKPIPVFASIALIASLVVAFSINPFLASFLYKPEASGHQEAKEGKFLKWYGQKLQLFINRDKKTEEKRKWLKIGFWITLMVVMIAPILLGVFKARMLPKADKNQVYLWIDASRNTTIETTSAITHDIEKYLLSSGTSLPAELTIIEDISAGIGERLPPDFANLFRGGNTRTQEHQISMRMNLTAAHDRDISSEEFVIALRPLLSDYILERYPDVTMRLLEDPPGPPTQATFHIKMKAQTGVPTASLIQFSNAVEGAIQGIKEKEELVDISNSHSSTSPSYQIVLNQDKILETGLSRTQVESTLSVYFGTIPVALARFEDGKYGATTISTSVGRIAQSDLGALKAISFINPQGKRISLDEIATIQNAFKSYDIHTDASEETIHLYAEMGANSVVYPVLHLYTLFGSEEFEKTGYKKISASPYAIHFENIHDGKEYTIEWGGEWELTMDTFRDLGIAMIFSLFVIYFIIVTQFGSFIVGGIVMTTFLLSFFGIFPGFSLLYLTSGTYFTATAMIGAIALGGIVVGNALILLDYINQLIDEGKSIEYSVIEGSKKRFIPVMLTSVAAVAGSFIITSDPVWSGLAWSIIWGLSASAVLTLYFIPIFYYTYLYRYRRDEVAPIQEDSIIEHDISLNTH